MSRYRKHILTAFICLWAVQLSAQLFPGDNWGCNIGLVAAIGNRFQRVGVTVQTYYFKDFAQVNAELRAYRNYKNLGPKLRYNELVTSAGLLMGYGARQTEHNPFLSVIGNQTGYSHSIGYAYNLYFNKIKTTQQTGTIAFQFNEWSIISENDIFARPTLDRFRTGAFLLQYQYGTLWQTAVNCTMWTGQMGHKVTDDNALSVNGYMDTTDGIYTNYSHGLLSGQFKMAIDRGQNLQANAGVDAEQVRNFVQNRLFHDLEFLPRRWRHTKSSHIPMLDTAGNQYLKKPGEEIKPAQLYWNVFSGAASFY